jgi:nanoRNase/pAp phosphatase (c-di-AMP/oligoRNAs hydrolase)
MSGIKGVDIWMCITEISEKNEFRVSIRSKLLDISGVATNYRGGGHKQASGATLYDLEKELPLLIKDLEELIENEA